MSQFADILDSPTQALPSTEVSHGGLGFAFLRSYRLAKKAWAKVFTLGCAPAFYRLGSHTVLTPPIRLGGTERIEIGKGVFLGSNSWLEVMSFATPGSVPVITIGEDTSIAGLLTITAVQQVVIEPGVLMARNVYISDHVHAHRRRDLPIKEQGITGIAPVRVGAGAWLGQNVVICPGARIGTGAVIGANSVVRSEIPDFCVAVGVPARVIRQIDEPFSR